MKPTILIALLTITILYLNSPQSAPIAEAAPVRLFSLLTKPAAAEPANRSSAASVSEAEIGFDRFSESEVNVPKLVLPTLAGKEFEAARSSFEKRGPGDFTWRGKIGEGDVVLTFKGQYSAGLIYAPDGVYEIVPKGEKQLLVMLDQALFPECAGDVRAPEERQPQIANATAAAIDSGDRIDVLVLYTAAVRNSLGGDGQAATFAQQAIDSTNSAYINSRIRQRVRLVGAQQTAIVETGSLSTELSALRGDSATATARNNTGADLVAMISNSTDNCGIGYLMGLASGNPTSAFTVTSRTCAVGNLSFAHELGHNMGSQHNPESGSGALYPYGYGHYVNGQFRTVMSYVDPCAQGCARVPYFSNPAVSYLGYPTGIEDTRDNARSINNTADTIANYRYSGASITLGNFNGGDMFHRLSGKTVSWTSDNVTGNVRIELSRDEGNTWETLAASTANDGSERISVVGRPTRRARLRISSIDDPTLSDSSVSNLFIR